MTKNFVKKTKDLGFQPLQGSWFYAWKEPCIHTLLLAGCSCGVPLSFSLYKMILWDFSHSLSVMCLFPWAASWLHHKIGSNSVLSVFFLTSSGLCLKGSPIFRSNIEEIIEWFGVESTIKSYLVPSPHPWVVLDQQQTHWLCHRDSPLWLLCTWTPPFTRQSLGCYLTTLSCFQAWPWVRRKGVPQVSFSPSVQSQKVLYLTKRNENSLWIQRLNMLLY